VRGLGLAVCEFHLLGITKGQSASNTGIKMVTRMPRQGTRLDYLPVIRSDEEHVALLLTSLINSANPLVRCLNTYNCSLVHTSVSNHVRRGKVVHDELKFALLNALGDLFCHTSSAHLRCLVVGCDTLVRGHQILRLITRLQREYFLYASVEKKCNVGVFFSFCDMDLLDTLGTKSLCQNVAHVLRLESNSEWIVELVLRHCCETNVLWVRKVRLWRCINTSEELCDFSNTVRAVVEEENLVAIYLS